MILQRLLLKANTADEEGNADVEESAHEEVRPDGDQSVETNYF